MSNHKSTYDYGSCHVCGEQMQEKRINQDFWLKGKLVVIESVPAGVCPQCGEKLKPAPTGESKPLQCTSYYALSKKDQEEMVLLFGRTYEVPAVALRFFNIYGSRQALSNPYTGVAAIFASRLMNGNSPLLFEDADYAGPALALNQGSAAEHFALTLDTAVRLEPT